jgi:hypothetical protein
MFYRLIISLTVVALLLAGHTMSTFQEAEEVQQEVSTYEASVVPQPLDAVDNFVKTVEKPDEEWAHVEAVSMCAEEEHEILSIIIYQEAGGDDCSDDTRRKVGSVFLNRVNSPLFPDTFEEVATGKRQYGTLYLTGIKWPDRASKAEEAHAVQRARDIAEELLFSGSILPTNVIWQAEFEQGDGIYCHQDEIYFCYSEVNK